MSQDDVPAWFADVLARDGNQAAPVATIFEPFGRVMEDLESGQLQVWDLEDRLHAVADETEAAIEALNESAVQAMGRLLLSFVAHDDALQLAASAYDDFARKAMRRISDDYLAQSYFELLADIYRRAPGCRGEVLTRILDEARRWQDEFPNVANVYRDLKSIEHDGPSTQLRQMLKVCAGLLESRYKQMILLLDDLFVLRGDLQAVAKPMFGDAITRVDRVLGTRFPNHRWLIDPDVVLIRNAQYHHRVDVHRGPAATLEVILSSRVQSMSLKPGDVAYYTEAIQSSVGIGGGFDLALRTMAAVCGGFATAAWLRSLEADSELAQHRAKLRAALDSSDGRNSSGD